MPRERHSLWIRLIYSVCLATGALMHWLDIAAAGWFPYRFAPLTFNAYWTGLAFADPLAALLLWHGRPAIRWTGALLTLAIMISDVAINSYVRLYIAELPLFALTLQSAFLGFVILTVRHLRPE